MAIITKEDEARSEVEMETPPASGLPPPYAPSSPPSSFSGASSSAPDPPTPPSPPPLAFTVPPPNIPASNFLTIKRDNTSIKGTYVIDAGLQTPPGLLPDDPDDARKNLSLQCKNGSISATVWLVGTPSSHDEDDGQARAVLDVRGHNGSVTLHLNATTTRPFALSASSKNGSVTASIPSSFIGPVEMGSYNGSITVSSAVQARLVTFSEVDGRRSCFIGDFRAAGYTGKGAWTGSTLDIHSHNGRVKLSFVDEAPEESISSGFWGKIFGGR
ncbi:hypothetical protein M0805_008476 [Coniferiporia weirii]|nr:hypothetical protein M0805_008476 [Coniferiporia weirii]